MMNEWRSEIFGLCLVDVEDEWVVEDWKVNKKKKVIGWW